MCKSVLSRKMLAKKNQERNSKGDDKREKEYPLMLLVSLTSIGFTFGGGGYLGM